MASGFPEEDLPAAENRSADIFPAASGGKAVVLGSIPGIVLHAHLAGFRIMDNAELLPAVADSYGDKT
mgnify:CR=1 FL=1